VATVLKRLLLLVLALALIAAPIAESATSQGGPVAGAAKKKKCKKKKKKQSSGAFSAKKKKCKKKKGDGGLPGKPLNPTPPADPDDPAPAIALAAVSMIENPLLAGTSGQGQVSINNPAPAGGQPVTLSSGVPSRASVPDSVHIAAGQTSATFPINTTAGPNDSVVITAAMEFSIRTATLDIVEEESLKSLALDYQCFPGLGTFGLNIVSLDVRAPTDVVVDLESSDEGIIDVPDTVTVLEDTRNGAFSVDTLAATLTPVTVTATYDDDVFQDSATVRDVSSPDPVASSVGLQPNSVVVGDPSTGTVTLDCEAPAGGMTVNLSSNNAGATVPAQVVVPEGSLSVTFPITTDVNTTPGTAQISATATSGPPTVQATLTLRAIGT
jgi:trimeric autotransporter adhesin